MDPESSPAHFDRRDLHATRMLDRLGEIGDERLRALTQRGLEIGLEAAPSVQDRRITTFARGGQPAFAGINLPQGAVLRGHPYRWRLRGCRGRGSVRHGHHLPLGCAIRPAGGSANIGAL